MQEESYIQITLQLAEKGKGTVSPLSLRGVIIVNEGKIVGAEFLKDRSSEQPEFILLSKLKNIPKGSVLYSNINPVIASGEEERYISLFRNSGIKKMVFGVLDNNSLFYNKIMKKLKESGISIISGVMEKESFDLNRFFLKYSSSKLPYVTLKMALTLDGKISDINGNSKWITSVESRSLVHELRSEYDAVLVGYNTVKTDKPSLTVRLVEGRNPKRIVLDSRLELKPNSDLVRKNKDNNLIIVTDKKNKDLPKLAKYYEAGVEFIFVPVTSEGMIDLKSLMRKLSKLKITSILVEGGGRVFSSFIKSKLDDEILLFIAPKLLCEGIPLCSGLGINSLSKAYKFQMNDVRKIGEDALIRLTRR
ncbi:bifunctional diaminohydroxyphosphoribosylaminopyrimidine deaminase/5-amino-6-(5-phosphoribosylamino)uracil reductase RibD [Melioribacter sp. Ez-97]|uniref:bifunctional diaminohydroxyphosphoribosylaminopyrimidine deaminase/5-amino-6-(5-phosphoribosylamino)uracil reductase RibD n=1 Tax=Melioribacter sp. Ez-97 TaxID=3423434 RepID=UPI003EDA0F09